MLRSITTLSSLFAGLLFVLASVPAFAQSSDTAPEAQADPLTYADIVDLAAASRMVVHATVKQLTRIDANRAPDIKPGIGRFYIEARTQALLFGSSAIGESVNYLADLPLSAKGRPPAIKKAQVLLFALPVTGRPSSVQLLSSSAQLLWSPEREARVRAVLAELASPDAPAVVTGVREILYVPGDLAGQGETQIFLKTQDGSAASITVRHAGGAPPAWGVSFSELVADIGHPPARDTLAWYRLACFLPNALPSGINVSETYASSRQAESDYRMVLGELGVCPRTLDQ